MFYFAHGNDAFTSHSFNLFFFAAPGIPQSFTCGNTSKGRIDLGWEKPAEPNGIITSYDLTWNASKGSESLNTDAHVFSRSIYGLSKCYFS